MSAPLGPTAPPIPPSPAPAGNPAIQQIIGGLPPEAQQLVIAIFSDPQILAVVMQLIELAKADPAFSQGVAGGMGPGPEAMLFGGGGGPSPGLR
jgi:hypothetical protein